MLYEKTTYGYVVQVFNDAGQCVSQKFVADDDGETVFASEDGNEINRDDMPFGGNECYPFDMEQPH